MQEGEVLVVLGDSAIEGTAGSAIEGTAGDIVTRVVTPRLLKSTDVAGRDRQSPPRSAVSVGAPRPTGSWRARADRPVRL